VPDPPGVEGSSRGPAWRWRRPPEVDASIPVGTQSEVLRDFVLGVTFDDGTMGEVDLLPHLWSPAFEPLRDDPGLFAHVRVDADEGTIVWPNGADVASEMTSIGSRPVPGRPD
jgi:hypothetical protein